MIKFKIIPLLALLAQLTTALPALQAQSIGEDWEYTSFVAAGLDSTRFKLLKARIQDGTFRKVDGLVIVKDGKILVEEYFNGYDRNKLHEIRSATKSLGSALMGIAIDLEYISGIQDKLYAYFQERKPFQNWDVRKNEITLKNVLNMTTGLDCNDMDNSSAGNEDKVIEATDIVRFMLDLPVVYGPGEHWAYSTGSAHLIGAVIESATGLSVQDFARTYLFEPLNITQYQWKTTGGISHTGGGFWMLPIDMAKFGQLYLNNGHWHGQKILSQEWIDESSKIHINVTNDTGYGYLWWKWIFDIDGRLFPAFSAQGNGENHIFVLPDLEIVIVLTGSAYQEDYGPPQTFMMMSNYILPAVVQDRDPHRNNPHLRTVPKTLFALCSVPLILALILWPVGFIIRRIRPARVKKSENRRVRVFMVTARILSALATAIILCLLALFLTEALPFDLLLNSGMSHPLGIFEVFLGTAFINIVGITVWILVLLTLIQMVFMVLAHKNKWWTLWQRWHFSAMTLAASCFVSVLLWWGFGNIPL